SKDVIAEKEETEESVSDRLFYEAVYARATEENTKIFLHEFRLLVGFLEVDANREIDCYACSNTRASVARIQSFLEAFDMLSIASQAPITKDFDLTDLVVQVSELESRRNLATSGIPPKEGDGRQIPGSYAEPFFESTGIRLTLSRREPVFCSGAPNLIKLALGNALRNAVEATLAVQDNRNGEIVLTWGITDIDNWIVVLDEGCGLPAGSNRLMEIGVSTKNKRDGNFGMGLAIARNALRSIDGTIELTPQPGLGVRCEIRWPQRRTQH
ncbi:sensor histidine kinase, partial [Candidatus Poribacteria bacterium]|nr:sensor histidine kinase [Candidatus Poribacteria bacterium]